MTKKMWCHKCNDVVEVSEPFRKGDQVIVTKNCQHKGDIARVVQGSYQGAVHVELLCLGWVVAHYYDPKDLKRADDTRRVQFAKSGDNSLHVWMERKKNLLIYTVVKGKKEHGGNANLEEYCLFGAVNSPETSHVHRCRNSDEARAGLFADLNKVLGAELPGFEKGDIVRGVTTGDKYELLSFKDPHGCYAAVVLGGQSDGAVTILASGEFVRMSGS